MLEYIKDTTVNFGSVDTEYKYSVPQLRYDLLVCNYTTVEAMYFKV